MTLTVYISGTFFLRDPEHKNFLVWRPSVGGGGGETDIFFFFMHQIYLMNFNSIINIFLYFLRLSHKKEKELLSCKCDFNVKLGKSNKQL